MTRRHSISEPGRSTGKKARPYRIPHWHRRHRHPDRASGKVLPRLRRRGAVGPEAERQTGIASDAAALPPVNATVADAVRIGADAVGCTLYVGMSAQEADSGQYLQVSEDAQRLGMPLIGWAAVPQLR